MKEALPELTSLPAIIPCCWLKSVIFTQFSDRVQVNVVGDLAGGSFNLVCGTVTELG